MSNDPDTTDQELEDYLQGKSEISSLYAKSKDVKVPDELAASIKAMARSEMARERSNKSWIMPLALAATILLSVTVYLLILQYPATTEEPQIAQQETPSQPVTTEQQKIAATPDKKEQTALTSNETEQVPAHIRDLIQPTGKRQVQQAETYPTPRELKTWTIEQWAKKIKQLRKDGRKQEAERYIKDFRKYHPESDIEQILQRYQTNQ